mmetsp:Transcript_29377/g.87105  ORF Transcript_29377/g.87105 Transcript_29377/m.87105 type:complete len:322 (-) Transcript_29377:580-1545(-)|eukprot:CAMPEP_0113541130 /NCGR_PEP_ID=MMETSP0015_2-20120614/8861_1 /TAXON_ID=2838 /ORGANISM="Odontella" /LENGTH=321 /DNA_ID=CAMNT_0000441003 /DNA_START=166 /DNA_END=1131 /DNA_ORIENTATION=- /assembly_acc=CAM_ASM_000160
MIVRNTVALSALLAATTICASSSAFAPSAVPSAFVARSTQIGRTSAPSTALSYGRRGRPRGPVRTIIEKPPMNAEIEFDEVRVVALDPNGGKDEALGVMTKADALAEAKSRGGVDLILINAQSLPPVCKIAEYSKYRYIEEKKKKDKKKASKTTEVKEVKMSYKIDKHDYEVRQKNASKFIQQGNRVKCTVQFRGREIQHEQLGKDLLGRLAEDMTKICTMENKPKREGRTVSCIMSPRPEIFKAINDSKRAEEKAKKKKREASLAKAQAATAKGQALKAGGAAAAKEAEAAVATLALDDDDLGDVDELLGGDALTDDLFS